MSQQMEEYLRYTMSNLEDDEEIELDGQDQIDQIDADYLYAQALSMRESQLIIGNNSNNQYSI